MEPTDEQLARFACVALTGSRPTPSDVGLELRMFALAPSIRDVWLARHRQMQEAVWALADGSEGPA